MRDAMTLMIRRRNEHCADNSSVTSAIGTKCLTVYFMAWLVICNTDGKYTPMQVGSIWGIKMGNKNGETRIYSESLPLKQEVINIIFQDNVGDFDAIGNVVRYKEWL